MQLDNNKADNNVDNVKTDDDNVDHNNVDNNHADSDECNSSAGRSSRLETSSWSSSCSPAVTSFHSAPSPRMDTSFSSESRWTEAGTSFPRRRKKDGRKIGESRGRNGGKGGQEGREERKERNGEEIRGKTSEDVSKRSGERKERGKEAWEKTEVEMPNTEAHHFDVSTTSPSLLAPEWDHQQTLHRSSPRQFRFPSSNPSSSCENLWALGAKKRDAEEEDDEDKEEEVKEETLNEDDDDLLEAESAHASLTTTPATPVIPAATSSASSSTSATPSSTRRRRLPLGDGKFRYVIQPPSPLPPPFSSVDASPLPASSKKRPRPSKQKNAKLVEPVERQVEGGASQSKAKA